MQYVKQIVDLDTLFEHIADSDDLRITFSQVVQLENTLHSTAYDAEETAHSIIGRALEYCRLNLPGADPDSPVIRHMQSGLRRIGSTLVDRYRSEALKSAMARAAYGAAIISNPRTDNAIIQQPDPDVVSSVSAWKSEEWMASLRRTNRTAFFYLALALEHVNG